MSDFSEYINRLTKTYDGLFALVADYPVGRREQLGVCGVWSPKQVLAHFSGWLVEGMRRYDDFAAGDHRNVTYDFDSFNARSVKSRAHLSWDQTLGELKTLFEQYVRRLERITHEQVAADRRYRDWVTGLRRDCEEHTKQLEEFIR